MFTLFCGFIVCLCFFLFKSLCKVEIETLISSAKLVDVG